MSEVSIIKCNEYNQVDVDEAVGKLIDNLGGIGKFVKQGDRVLLKPNLLYGRSPDKCVTTHPAVVASVAKLLKRHNCDVFIGDSPAIGTCHNAAKKAGLVEVADRVKCDIVDFKDSIQLKKSREDNIFKDIEVASSLSDYDAIINLAKVKTHGQMGLTLGVKNMFGCVVGTRKVHWHLKAGVNKDFFAKMLLEIYCNVKPVLTITDGITGMEGNGPQNGKPRKLGLLVASQDAVASDVVISHLVNFNPEKLFTNLAAREKGIGATRLEEIAFRGEGLSSFDIVDFKKVPVSGLEFEMPSFMAGFFKNTFSTRPIVDFHKCRLCKLCFEICPPKVISLKKNKVFIDHRNCIRCFCCQEICPHGAISITKNWLSGIFG